MIKKMIEKIIPFCRTLYNQVHQKKLTNKNFSIIASNCNGACISHDLGVRFNSPFVNLWLKPDDFLRFLHDMDHYLNCSMIFTKEEGVDYPIGILDDVKIYFQHYSSETEAEKLWEERKIRINRENLFIMMTDRDGCTVENLLDFDSLPFEHKVAFTHKPMDNITSAFYIPGFEKEDSVGICSEFINPHSYKKYYDFFPYVQWFNGKR